MSKFTKLLELNDYADAKPILESAKNLSDASYTLAQTAYQIKETQPQVARNFLKTVIKECEHEDDKDKIKEVDGGKSEQSSSTTGLEKVGSEEPDGAEPVTGATDTKDQMGVAIGEMAPPMGVPPPAGAPPPPQAPPMVPPPPAPPVPPVQSMQYSVQEALAIRGQFKAFKEAIASLTKQIQETQNSQIRSIDVGVGSKGTPSSGSFIQETTGNKEIDLQVNRLSISKMNDEMNKQR